MISEQKAAVSHGILLMALFSFSAFYISEFQWVKDLSLSPLIVGIILGMIYANSLRNYIPETWVPGIKFCTKQILRTGIVLYGFRLTFQQVLAIGLPAIIIDVIVIVITLLLGVVAGRLMKMDEKTSLMVSTGSAICGAAAVLGAEPVVKCAPHKTAIAVSTVVIFGTLSMFLYPILYRTGVFDLSPQEMAIYAGSTLHEVAHVVGAGNAMDPDGALHLADQATITKMIRVMMLAPVLLIMSYIIARVRRARHTDVAADGKSKISVPWFAFGFLLVIALNSLLQSFTFIPAEVMSTGISAINSFDNFLLTMAMTALGAETSIDKFKQAGAKPFYLAGIIYLWLLFGGYALCKYLVPALS
ncbi:MAG TPA: YeiH family putative sulfate export transporter [Candidatus Caccoplasma merdavium]|nr:YeiH family putative sulfate export transporter [Candidatus Caccoplasma merdavium]